MDKIRHTAHKPKRKGLELRGYGSSDYALKHYDWLFGRVNWPVQQNFYGIEVH